MLKRITLGLAVLTVLVLGTASAANAQYYGAPPRRTYGYPPPPPPPPAYRMYRSGLIIGGALGFGGMSAYQCGDVCGFSGAGEFHIGGMLNPRLALMGDFWGNWHHISNSDASSIHSLYTLALQYWATDIFWIKGGLGGSTMSITSDFDGFTYSDESGLGFLAAGGLEIVQAGFFAVDVQLRYGHGFFDIDGDVNSWAVMIGANWF